MIHGLTNVKKATKVREGGGGGEGGFCVGFPRNSEGEFL